MVREWEPPAAESLQGLLPTYQAIRFIARGGMGAVYEARHPVLQRSVAIKLLPDVLRTSNPGFAQRFLQEAKALASLSHPGIVCIHEAGELRDKSLYFVMEHVTGGDLGKTLKTQGRLAAATVLRLGIQVCDALQAAHERGIIHRDIKPANLMLTDAGDVKVADFGLARTPQSGELELTRTKLVLGTPCFTAPELEKGEAATVRSDIYALGVTLYQLLTGHLPQGAFLPPSQHVAGLDRRWDAILLQAMRAEPSQRQADASELMAQLETLQRPAHGKRWLWGLSICLLLSMLAYGLSSWAKLPALDKPINLLAEFDPQSFALFGKWRRVPDGLFVEAGNDGPFIISAPFEAGTDFDFEIEFSTANPDVSTFNQFFPVGDTLVEWTLNAHPSWSQPYHGFPRLDGANLVDTEETYSRAPIRIEPGKRYRSRVEVRQGQLSGYFGDSRLVLWRGDVRRFTRTPHFPIPRGHFALLSWTGGATFHRATVTRRAAHSAPAKPQTIATSISKPHANSLGMKFVPLPGTQILMGIHEVRRQDYAIYAAAVGGVNPSWQNVERGGFPVGHEPDHPVVNVNWYEAKAFCDWLSLKEGLRYRLPTDREWSIAVGLADREPAAFLTPEELGRMNQDLYPWGKQWPPPKGAGNLFDTEHYQTFGEAFRPFYTDGHATTAPVMSFAPNALGIYDLSGNVWEWCEDWVSSRKDQRCLRGGHFGDTRTENYLSSCRADRTPSSRFLCDGFRCVIDFSVPPTAPAR